MRRFAPLLALLTLLCLALLAHAQEAGPAVMVVKVDGSIDRTVDAYLRDAIADAEADDATVVIQLDSAGTLDVDPVALARRVHEATVPVIVWVGPAPAKAQGAGLLLLYAASAGAVAPGIGIGPVLPLDLVDGSHLATEDEVRDLAAAWAAERGREVPTLFPLEPVPAQAAIDGGVATVAASSITGLLDALDGETVESVAGPVTLQTRVATAEGEPTVNVRFVDLGPIARILHAAASPTWVYVLLVLGVAALAFEVTQPGFGFAGFSGLGMVGLGVYGLTVVPFSWVGLVLLLGGMALLTGDVLVRKLGPLTAAGMVAFVAGSLLTFADVAEQIDVSPWLVGSSGVAALLYWGFGLTVAMQSRDRISSTQKGLVGLVGETRGELKPEGPVYVKGTMWRGRTMNGPIPSGTRIRVRSVDGLILRVQPEPGAAGGDDPEED